MRTRTHSHRHTASSVPTSNMQCCWLACCLLHCLQQCRHTHTRVSMLRVHRCGGVVGSPSWGYPLLPPSGVLCIRYRCTLYLTGTAWQYQVACTEGTSVQEQVGGSRCTHRGPPSSPELHVLGHPVQCYLVLPSSTRAGCTLPVPAMAQYQA